MKSIEVQASTTAPEGRALAEVAPRAWLERAAAGLRVRWSARRLPLVMIGILTVAFVLRLDAAAHLSIHLDEASSVLAAHAVAERGVPILPSGTVYLHGATVSYLLAPLVWLGLGDLVDNTLALRLLCVLSGTAAVYLTFRLGRAIAGDARVGVVAALFLAIDPLSLQWSGHVRMYAPLQALTVGLAWVFLRCVQGSPSRRTLSVLVALTWLAVFTHVLAVVLCLAMVLVAGARYGRALLREQRDLAVALGLGLLAPVLLFLLNRLPGPGLSGTADDPVPGVAFVGDHLVDLGRALRPDLANWELLFTADHQAVFAGLMPVLIATLGAMLTGRYVLVETESRDEPTRRVAVLSLLALYWMPILAVASVVTSPRERYLLNVQPLGYALAAAALVALGGWRAGPRDGSAWPSPLRVVTAAGIALVMLAHLGDGLAWQRAHPVVMPDYIGALRYVEARRVASEPVLVSMPPPAYLVLGSMDGLYFLAGQEERPAEGSRVERYTRPTSRDRADYWLGVPAITSTAGLCRALKAQPRAWIVIEDPALFARSWAYRGPMADVLRGATRQVFTAEQGAAVLRPKPPLVWSRAAKRGCGP